MYGKKVTINYMPFKPIYMYNSLVKKDRNNFRDKFNLSFHDNRLLENLFTFGILSIYFTEHFIYFIEENIF